MSDYDNMNADNVKRDPKVVSALICRYIILPISSPGGRVAIVVEAGRDAADAADAVYACKANPPPACERSTGALTSGAFEDGEVVWS